MTAPDEWIGAYFKRSEVACSCGCGRATVDPKLIELADKVREALGVGLQVNSAVRCLERNAAVGGRQPGPDAFGSLHIPRGALHQGHALDLTFAAPSQRRPINILRLYCLMESHGRKYGPLGLGLYSTPNGNGGGFVHVDTRGALGLAAARWEDFAWPKI